MGKSSTPPPSIDEDDEDAELEAAQHGTPDPQPVVHDPSPDPVPGLLHARSINLLSGLDGGKTHWLGWLGAQLLEGEELLGRRIESRPSLIAYITGDGSRLESTRTQFHRAGWRNPRCYSTTEHATNSEYLRELRTSKANPKEGLQDFPLLTVAMHAIAHPWPAGALVMVDGLALTLGIDPAGFYRPTAAALGLLKLLAQERDCSFLLVHRDVRKGYMHAAEAAIHAAVDTHFRLEAKPSGIHHLQVQARSIASRTVAFSRASHGLFTQSEEVDAHSLPMPPSALAALGALPEGPQDRQVWRQACLELMSRDRWYLAKKVLKAAGMITEEVQEGRWMVAKAPELQKN